MTNLTIEEQIKETKGNHINLMNLVASKFNREITRETLIAESPKLFNELMRYGQIDYDLTYINIEILCNKRA